MPADGRNTGLLPVYNLAIPVFSDKTCSRMRLLANVFGRP